MRHAVRPRAGPRRLFLVRSIRLNAPNGAGRAAPQRLACRVDATPPGGKKPQRSMPSFCNRVEYCEVKPVSEFLQTHGPRKLRHRPNPLLPSLSQTLPTSFTPLRDRKRRRPCTVKKISGHQHTIPIDRGFCATDVHLLVIPRQAFGISRHVGHLTFMTVMRVMKRGYTG